MPSLALWKNHRSGRAKPLNVFRATEHHAVSKSLSCGMRWRCMRGSVSKIRRASLAVRRVRRRSEGTHSGLGFFQPRTSVEYKSKIAGISVEIRTTRAKVARVAAALVDAMARTSLTHPRGPFAPSQEERVLGGVLLGGQAVDATDDPRHIEPHPGMQAYAVAGLAEACADSAAGGLPCSPYALRDGLQQHPDRWLAGG